jgi:hypothetical protein
VSPTLQNPSDDKLIQIGYATADARKLRDYLAAHGAPVPSRVTKDSDGNYSFVVEDPEGHTLEFVQYLEGWLQSRYSGKGISDRRISDHILHVGVHVKSPVGTNRIRSRYKFSKSYFAPSYPNIPVRYRPVRSRRTSSTR